MKHKSCASFFHFVQVGFFYVTCTNASNFFFFFFLMGCYYACSAGLPTQASEILHLLYLATKKIFVRNWIFSRPTNPTFGAVWDRNQTIIFAQPYLFTYI